MRVTRFDHAAIAVPDLDAAIVAYRELGFDVSAGGKHTGRGTHNAIIRFGLDYLELLSIYDRDLAIEHGSGELISFLERTGGGLIGFALASDDLDSIAAAWTSGFAPLGKPEAMERVRPDGFRLSWRLLIPGGTPWLRPWPFLIQWETPDEARVKRDAPGHHSNGASGVAGVTVTAGSVPALLPLYVHDLGLEGESEHGGKAVLDVGTTRIRLIEHPSKPGQKQPRSGLHEIELRVSDLKAAADQTGGTPDGNGGLLIPPERTIGARIVLVGAG
ncbi:MAG: VOC family protein [Candidatus Dormibacteraceae bacterium]